MIGFSLEPDEWMRWIYDSTHPEYNTRGKDLRERRFMALHNAPRWMIEQAAMNDELKKLNQPKG